jgi:hypothetical protein
MEDLDGKPKLADAGFTNKGPVAVGAILAADQSGEVATVGGTQ